MDEQYAGTDDSKFYTYKLRSVRYEIFKSKFHLCQYAEYLETEQSVT